MQNTLYDARKDTEYRTARKVAKELEKQLKNTQDEETRKDMHRKLEELQRQMQQQLEQQQLEHAECTELDATINELEKKMSTVPLTDDEETKTAKRNFSEQLKQLHKAKQQYKRDNEAGHPSTSGWKGILPRQRTRTRGYAHL